MSVRRGECDWRIRLGGMRLEAGARIRIERFGLQGRFRRQDGVPASARHAAAPGLVGTAPLRPGLPLAIMDGSAWIDRTVTGAADALASTRETLRTAPASGAFPPERRGGLLSPRLRRRHDTRALRAARRRPCTPAAGDL